MESQEKITETPATEAKTFVRVGIVKRVNDDLIAIEMEGKPKAYISQDGFVKVVNGEIPYYTLTAHDEVYGGERTEGYAALTRSGKGVLIRRDEYYVASLAGVVKVLNHAQNTTSISRRV